MRPAYYHLRALRVCPDFSYVARVRVGEECSYLTPPHPSPSHIHPPTARRTRDRPAAVVQSPTSPAERNSTAKPAQEAISTLRGEGTRGTAGSRGQVWGRVRGRLQTILPQRLRSPNLACKMRPRHAARVQRPSGQIPRGHTARNPRESDDTLAHGHARASTRPPGHPRKPRSECEPKSFRTREVRTPLDRSCHCGWLVEARVSEPGPGTRTLLPHVPGRKYIWGGFCETVCEQHMSRHNRTDYLSRFLLRKFLWEDSVLHRLGMYARPDVGRANHRI